MLKLVFFSFLIVGVLFAASNSETNKPAIVNVTMNVSAVVTIEENFIDDSQPLIGENYSATVENNVQGAIVSSDGYVVLSGENLDNESVAKSALLNTKDSIIYDAGNTLHANKYLENASKEQLDNYRKQVSEGVGGETKLVDIFTKAYQDGKIKISISTEIFEVNYLGGQKKYGKVIGAKNGIVLLKIDDDNLPVISLVSSQTNNNNLIIQTPQGNSATFLSNGNGESTALISGDKIIDNVLIDEIMEENGIIKKEPDYKKDYESGVELYKQGNESEALDKFKTVLKLQPDHSYAKEYVDVIENKLEEDQFKSAILDKAYSLGKSVKNKLPNKLLVAFPYIMIILLIVLFTAIGSRITGNKKHKKTRPSIQK
ncbi:MAG: hypothetical protein Q7S22_02030 [Candidatus Micrarchaeota archaeon]|nr:hypothetical protein [Candidatus Micrarchaeota archaeon]